MDTVNESLTTVEDGDTTVNERLSPGGEGPEGQPDTASESLSGVTEPPAADEPVEDKPVEKPAKKARKS